MIQEEWNTMLTIAVCDDEQQILEQFGERIRRQLPQCALYLYTSAEQLLADRQQLDLCFIDIQLNGKNGITLARQLRAEKEELVIIFLTALKDYVFDAFDVGAFHYLLKPVDDQKFCEVLDRAVQSIEKRADYARQQLFIQTRKRNYTIHFDEIYYLENQKRKIIVHGRNGQTAFYGAMAQLERQLGDSFYRCHRGYLVNLAHVAEYTADTIQLSNKESIYLSKDRYADFVKCYMRYLRQGGVCHV